jgi:hypothetical protein
MGSWDDMFLSRRGQPLMGWRTARGQERARRLELRQRRACAWNRSVNSRFCQSSNSYG